MAKSALLGLLGLFVTCSLHAMSCTEAFTATQPLSISDYGIPVELQHKTSYAFPRDNAIRLSTLSSDGNYVAAVSKSHTLQVQHTSDGHVVATQEFSNLESLNFLASSPTIAVFGTPLLSDSRPQLHLLSLTPSKALPTGNLDMPITPSIFSSLRNLPAALRSDRLKTLDLQNDAGAKIEQFIARSDLSYSLAIEKLPNSQSKAVLLSRDNYLPIGQIEFDGLTPTSAELNPRSSLVALHLVAPQLPYPNNMVAIVDMTHPNVSLYRYNLMDPPDVSMKWSQDGMRLVISEKETGTIVLYDLQTGHEMIWGHGPSSIEQAIGVEPLRSGDILVLRQSGARSMAAQVLNSHQTENPTTLFTLDVDSHWGTYLGAAELHDGKVWALLFQHFIVLIDPAHPDRRTIIQTGPQNRIGAAVQMGDSTLRLSDEQSGVYDLVLR